MARERGTSLLHSQEEASFFGPKVPNVIKIAAPYLEKVDRSILRKFIQGNYELSKTFSKLL